MGKTAYLEIHGSKCQELDQSQDTGVALTQHKDVIQDLELNHDLDHNLDLDT